MLKKAITAPGKNYNDVDEHIALDDVTKHLTILMLDFTRDLWSWN